MDRSGKRMWPSRLRRLVGIVAVASLALLAIYGRCRQIEHHRTHRMESAFAELARVLGSTGGDLTPVLSAFRWAMGDGFGDGYSMFCLDAVRELASEGSGDRQHPPGWEEGLAALRGGRLDEARRLFMDLEKTGNSHGVRARLYLRLIEDIERHWSQ